MTAAEYEAKTRTALQWALDTSCLILPAQAQSAAAWTWDEDDASFTYETISERLDFHVELIVGRQRIRVAMLTCEDDQGKVTWEADIPSGETI